MDEEEKTNSDDERRPNAAEWALLRSEHVNKCLIFKGFDLLNVTL